MDISNIVSTEFEEVEPETRVSKLRGIFEETNIKAVIVVDKPGYQGIVTQRELISSHLNPGQKASSVMRNAPKVTKHEDVREVARLMVESNSKVLPVFEGDSLYGVITANDLLEEVNSYLNVLSVEDVYTQNLITVGTETTVGEIINKLRENAISRVPVVDEGRLEGIVTIYDIIGFTVRDESKTKGGGSESYGGLGSRQGEMKRMLDIPARDVMNSPVETTNPDEPLDNVVDRMIEMNYSSLVVVSPDTGEPIGVVTKTDILRSLTWEEEGRMDVQISNIDYLDTMTREDVVESIQSISEKYSEMQVLHSHVHLQKHKEQLRGTPLIMVRIILQTNKGQFIGTGEGYGAEHAFHVARNKLERNVLSAKQVSRSDREAERLFKELGHQIG